VPALTESRARHRICYQAAIEAQLDKNLTVLADKRESVGLRIRLGGNDVGIYKAFCGFA
jgi:hypothetical protein